MKEVTIAEELNNLDNGNRILGSFPQMKNSKISFGGKNNILYCEEGVILANSRIDFNGDDSVVFLCKNRHEYKIQVSINRCSVFYMGRNNYMNGTLNVVLSERKHCFIGNDGLFSFGIWIRNADPHLIYDCDSRRRINPSCSVYLGDHVWIGQGAMLLKGTQIDSGSIIGAMSLVSGKKIAHNTSCGGNPVRVLRKDIFWDGSCVHKWDEAKSEMSQHYDDYIADNNNAQVDDYIFCYDHSVCVPWETLESYFDKANVDDKVLYLKQLTATFDKNRFAHNNSLEHGN